MPWTNADGREIHYVAMAASSAAGDRNSGVRCPPAALECARRPFRVADPALLRRRGGADARSSSTRTVYMAQITLYGSKSRKVSTSQIH